MTNAEPALDAGHYFEQEQPVGRAGDILFPATEGLLDRLRRVGDMIATASQNVRPDRGVTFLISGEWGTGKSSALRYLEEHIGDRAPDTIVFVHYSAPMHEEQPGGARASMLLEIIMALQDAIARDKYGLPTELTDFILLAMQRPGFIEPRHPEPAVNDAVSRLYAQRFLAETLTESLAEGAVLEHWLHHFVELTKGPRLTTVVLVDDLDRCRSSEFVKDVLVTTSYYAHLNNHFFVIAADQTRVRAALNQHLVVSPSETDVDGMSKYVHVTVELPPKIPSRRAAAELFGEYLKRTILPAALQTALLEHLSSGTGATGLLEPLLDLCTPRTLKERFNHLVSILGNTAEFSAATIQRAVIEIRWPVDYRRHIEPAILGGIGQIAWCQHLLALAQQILERKWDIEESAARSLAQQAAESGMVLGDTDPRLGLYLATAPPSWLTTRRDEVSESGRTQWDAANLFKQPAELPATNELTLKVAQLQAAADAGAVEIMKSEFAAVAELIERATELPVIMAGPLGNVALDFEAYDDFLQEALQLHGWAITANPRHVNVGQNAVDFILDHQIAHLYADAERILASVEHGGDKSTNFRPHRTALLRLRLDLLTGKDVDRSEYESLVTAAIAEGTNWTAGDLFDLLQTVDDTGRFDLAEAIGATILDREKGDLSARAVTLRGLGTIFAMSREEAHENYAMQVYLFLLQSGHARGFNNRALGQMLLNFATLLERRPGSDPVIGYLVWLAAGVNSEDQNARMRLIRRYSSIGDDATAKLMLEGAVVLPSEPPAAPPFRQPLFPPSQQAIEFAAGYFPSDEFVEPLYPELVESPGLGTEGATARPNLI